MSFVKIIVNIHATKQGEAYRLYVGSDLMTERTFLWDPANTYVEEHVIIETENVSLQDVTVRAVSGDDCFSLRNVTAINI